MYLYTVFQCEIKCICGYVVSDAKLLLIFIYTDYSILTSLHTKSLNSNAMRIAVNLYGQPYTTESHYYEYGHVSFIYSIIISSNFASCVKCEI